MSATARVRAWFARRPARLALAVLLLAALPLGWLGWRYGGVRGRGGPPTAVLPDECEIEIALDVRAFFALPEVAKADHPVALGGALAGAASDPQQIFEQVASFTRSSSLEDIRVLRVC